MPKRTGLIVKIREILRQNPNFVDRTDDLCNMAGCTKQSWYNIKSQLKKQGFLDADGMVKNPGRVSKPKTAHEVRRVEKFVPKVIARRVRLEVEMPGDGMVMKLRSCGGDMIGTLEIDSSGLKFKKANAKLSGERQLTWRTLEKLMDLGL